MSLQTTPRWDRLEILLKIAEEDRTRFCIRRYFMHVAGGRGLLPVNREAWCNTTACFAGHALCEWENPFWIYTPTGAVMISTNSLHGVRITEEAAKLLGLDDNIAFWLFCAFADAMTSTEGGELECMGRLIDEYKEKSAQNTNDIAIEYLRAACENKEFERPEEFLRRKLSE